MYIIYCISITVYKRPILINMSKLFVIPKINIIWLFYRCYTKPLDIAHRRINYIDE